MISSLVGPAADGGGAGLGGNVDDGGGVDGAGCGLGVAAHATVMSAAHASHVSTTAVRPIRLLLDVIHLIVNQSRPAWRRPVSHALPARGARDGPDSRVRLIDGR